MASVVNDLKKIGENAREAARTISGLPSIVRNRALTNIANALIERSQEILMANDADLEAGRSNNMSKAAMGRLELTPDSLTEMADGVNKITAIPDPIGESFDMHKLPNGLHVSKRRVPLGVIASIYESRPNVTIDISVLSIKSGNAVILRGGKEAIQSNKVLANIVRSSIESAGIPKNGVQLIESTHRSIVSKMLLMKKYIDLIIPRGGADLVRRVGEEALMPSITGGIGVCHIYIDREADITMAVAIVMNSKTSRPHACNAVDTLLIHSGLTSSFLKHLSIELYKAKVEMRCDSKTVEILKEIGNRKYVPSNSKDWGKEFLSLTLAIKIVDSLEEALSHIEKYGSGHTETVVSENYSVAMNFLDKVDSSVVLVNASTVFNDGGQLGLGAEVAISTNKLHARGPMGLMALTSYKWTVLGTGQLRV